MSGVGYRVLIVCVKKRVPARPPNQRSLKQGAAPDDQLYGHLIRAERVFGAYPHFILACSFYGAGYDPVAADRQSLRQSAGKQKRPLTESRYPKDQRLTGRRSVSLRRVDPRQTFEHRCDRAELRKHIGFPPIVFVMIRIYHIKPTVSRYDPRDSAHFYHKNRRLYIHT